MRLMYERVYLHFSNVMPLFLTLRVLLYYSRASKVFVGRHTLDSARQMRICIIRKIGILIWQPQESPREIMTESEINIP